jgi:hypothetical protein
MSTTIKIYSFGSKESLDLRCILEGMYRRFGRVVRTDFPDDNTVEIELAGEYDFSGEYGIHKMTRLSPREESPRPRTSYVMVEINECRREEIVCSYTFNPIPNVENHILDISTSDLMWVLGGNPLGMKQIRRTSLRPAYA